jgi:predicted phage tail component-like protein
MEHVTFDGVRLTDTYDVASVRGVPTPRVVTEEVPARDGVVERGVTLDPPPVSITVITRNDGRTETAKRRELASIFAVREPKVLRFGGDGGLYYKVVPSSLDWTEFTTAGRLVVEFIVPEVAMYGELKTATIPSGGQVSITVGGTYPAQPKISGTVTRSPASEVWGVRIDNGDFVHVDTGSNASRPIVIDGEARTVKVAGVTKLPTLDSDWFELEVGSHTIRNDQGSGATTLTWIERWL